MKNPLLFLVALAGLASCSKHTDPAPPPAQPTLSRAELLTAGLWKLTAQRDVVTSQVGKKTATIDYPVTPGEVTVVYKTDGAISIGYPFQQGNPSAGGAYTLADSVLQSNISGLSGGGGVIRELTANRLVLVNSWLGFDELTQHTETFTH